MRATRLLAILSLASTSLRAQESGSATVQQHLEVPDARTAVAAPRGGTVILASEGKKTSLIGRIGWAAEDWTLGLSLEAPVEKPDEEEATLADESGLAGSTVATLTVSRVLYMPPGNVSNPEELDVTATCEEFNRLVLEAHRESLGLEKLAIRLSPELCTPEKVTDLGDFGTRALDKSRARALQATCDELAKVGLYDFTLGFEERQLAVAGEASPPGYLPEACGTDDRHAQEAQLAKLESATERFRSVASGSKRGVDNDLESKKKELENATKVWDATPVGLRTDETRRLLVRLKEDVERLESQVKSEAARDPRTWFEFEVSRQLAAICSKANEVPVDKLVDFHEQSSPEKGCEVSPFQQTVMASDLSPEEKARLALEIQRKLLPTVFYWTAAVSGGNQSFEYRKSGSLEPAEESKINRAFSGALTRATGIDGWTLGHSWRKIYKAGKKVQLCEPIPESDASTCATTVLTPPKRDDKDRSLSFLEYRRYTALQQAVGARVFYRHDLDQWGVRSTWFFLAKDKVGLDGGIDLGYDREREVVNASGEKASVGGFIARLFVGRRFELIPMGN